MDNDTKDSRSMTGKTSIRKCSRAVAIAVAASILSACGSGGGAEQAEDSSGSTTAGDINVSNLSASSLADVLKMRVALRRAKNADVARCMADKGFPQPMKAQKLAISVDNPGDASAVNLDPLDLGPYTEKLAKKYGVIGTARAARSTTRRPGNVVSKDPAFRHAQKKCRSEFDSTVNSDTAKLLKRVTQIANTVHMQLTQSAQDESKKLVKDILSCVRKNGYPTLRATPQGSFKTALPKLGIKPGSWSNRPPKPEVSQGETVVIPPYSPEYTPSPEEVEFALVYADCAQKSNLVERVEKMESKALAKILPRHKPEIIALGTKMKNAVRTATNDG